MIEEVKAFKVLLSKIKKKSESYQNHYMKYNLQTSQILKGNL